MEEMLSKYKIDPSVSMRDAFVVNTCYGGFGLSCAARQLYLKLKGQSFIVEDNENVRLADGSMFSDYGLDRYDPDLIKVVKELGKAASDKYARLQIGQECILHPDACRIYSEYDGQEYYHLHCRKCVKPEINKHLQNADIAKIKNRHRPRFNSI